MTTINQIFLHHIHRHIVSTKSSIPKYKILSKNVATAQTHQPFQTPNQTNTQPYHPIRNPVKTDYYQPTQMQNEIPLFSYLKQHEITKSQLTIFSQMPNAADSLQMTMSPYLMGGSSITSNKPLMIFTGTDPDYSVEDYLNAVTANLILKFKT